MAGPDLRGRQLEPARRTGKVLLSVGRWHGDCGRVLAGMPQNIFIAW